MMAKTWRKPYTVRTSYAKGPVTPSAATHNTILSRALVNRVVFRQFGVSLAVIDIFTPFPDISQHVVKTKVIR
jgi:hypothetical protein